MDLISPPHCSHKGKCSNQNTLHFKKQNTYNDSKNFKYAIRKISWFPKMNFGVYGVFSFLPNKSKNKILN